MTALEAAARVFYLQAFLKVGYICQTKIPVPTILRLIGFRFFFYSNEGNEPPHIHIEKGDAVAKFWLDEVELAESFGFNAKEINQLCKMVLENKETLIKSWYDYFKQN